MSEDTNKVILIGRLTKDCELTYTQSGYALGKMSIAVNKRIKDGDKWGEYTSFFDVVLWGKRAEALNKYLVKGQQIAIVGQIKQDRWEKDGQKRSRVIIEAENIQLLGGNKSGSTQNNAYSQAAPEEKFEDDIPF